MKTSEQIEESTADPLRAAESTTSPLPRDRSPIATRSKVAMLLPGPRETRRIGSVNVTGIPVGDVPGRPEGLFYFILPIA